MRRFSLFISFSLCVCFFMPFLLAQSPGQAVPTEDSIAPKAQVLDALAKHVHYTEEGPNTVGWITIGDKSTQITQGTFLYVRTALEYYKKLKPSFVVLELNTPGGEVFAAEKISDALKELDIQNDISVVAFINNWAMSAGALLAYSCRFIAVTKDASMGAAEPVVTSETGQTEAASEKVNSALRADFANRASFFDRNPDIAKAMVDKQMILVLRKGKIVHLDNEDQIQLKGPDPDVIITNKSKLLTLSSEELIRYGVADIYLPPAKMVPVTAQEEEARKWPADKTLLFQYPFFKKIPHAVVDVYRMDWKTRFFVLLSNPIVSTLLFFGMIMGFYIEINTPGFGLPGSVGLLCLFLLILSSFALEIANVFELVLLIAGLTLVVIDIFFVPTFGMLGIVGIILFLIGLFGMLLPGIGSINFEFDTQTFNAAGEAFIERLFWLSGGLVSAVMLIVVLGRYVLPSFQGFRRFVLEGREQMSSNGYVAGVDPSTLPQPGTKGIVYATLRPSGKVMISDDVYEAMTMGEFIDIGEPIIVVRLEGSVMMVERDTGEERP